MISSLQWPHPFSDTISSPDIKYHSIHFPTNLLFFLQAVQNIIRHVVQANNKHHRTKTTMQETNWQALHKAQHQPLTEIKERISVMQHHISQNTIFRPTKLPIDLPTIFISAQYESKFAKYTQYVLPTAKYICF